MALVWIAAAGTGGHVFPGLAVAEELIKQGHQLLWLGTKNGIENKIIAKLDIDLQQIAAKPLRGTGFFGCCFAGLSLFVAILQVFLLMLKNKPEVVLVMGGYVSAPVGLVARIMGVRLALHDQNAVPGLANKLLYRHADIVFSAFEGAFVAANKVKIVGNPVRANIAQVVRSKNTDANKRLRCLILGGSQGAKALNQKVLAAWLSMPLALRPLLWHQVGAKDELFYANKYGDESATLVTVTGFIDDMAKAYAWADVVISRSGAMTVSECLSIGLPVAWVPYPFAVDKHQDRNAEYFLTTSKGWIFQQKDLSCEMLSSWWQDCAENLAEYQSIASQSRHKDNDSAKTIVDHLF